MQEESSLVIFTQAAAMLAAADTIQKAKELKDMALTAADFAKRKHMGKEAILYCRSYALEAERKMGEMLASMPISPRAESKQAAIQSHDVTANSPTPTLTELGLSKRESSEAQMLATLPSETFEAIRAGEKSVAKAKAEANLETRRERQIAETKTALVTEAIVFEGDCLSMVQIVEPIDLLIADPPYFTDGDFSAHVSAYLAKVKTTGQAYIFASANPDEIAAYLMMDAHHMRLEQILIWNYNNTGQRQPNSRYTSNYQLCFYYRGPEAPAINKPSDGTHQYACQTINAPDGRLGDRFHAWQKPLELLERLIRNSSAAGEFVFDPFVGSGASILAASKLGRRAAGCDNDPTAIAICVRRGCVRGEL